jgi:outer membrane protein insertion porin family
LTKRFRHIPSGRWLRALILALSVWAMALSGAWAEDAMWAGLPATVAEVHVNVEDRHPNGVNWEGLARSLIRLKPGDRLTTDRMDEALKALAQIASVRVDTQARPEAIALFFTIHPHKRIKTITVSGAYPLFEKEVLNAMTVSAGDLFFEAKMAEQERAVAQRYRIKGYLDPRVRVTWSEDPHDGHYHLRVKIDNGQYHRLEKVRLVGNRAISDTRILPRLKTWRKAAFVLGQGRFDTEEFREDVRKLTDYYREEGYAEVVVTAKEHRDAAAHSVICEFIIDEGPHYTIRLSGNKHFARFRLRNEMVLFKVGNLGSIGQRRTVQNIRRRYLKAGFAEVKVLARETSRVEGQFEHREITIEIAEGARHLVTAVNIQGNSYLPTKTLRKQMLTRPAGLVRSGAFVAETLREDMTSVAALYRSHGFLNAQVQQAVKMEENSAVTVTVTIDEGVQTLVGSVSRQGGDGLPKDPLTTELELRTGAPYTPFKLQNDENRISAYLAQMGYPHAEVNADQTLTADQARVDIIHSITPGPEVRMGDVFFLGNFRTRERFMRREVDLAPGDPFVLQEVLESQRNLRDLNIFESVQVVPIGLKEKESTADLIVGAVEKEPYYFELGGGYQTDTGFFGRGKLGDLNFLGTGKDTSVGGRISEVGYRWDLGMGEPRFLGLPIQAKAGLYGEVDEPFNQDFGTETRGAKLGFFHDWKTNNTLGLASRLEQRQQYALEQSATEGEDPDAFDNRTVLVVTPSVQYDGRDSFIRPKRGQFAGFSVDVSKGLDNTLDDFLRYHLDLRAYHEVVEKVTLAARTGVGYLNQYGGDVSPQDQLFFLGGTNSVRGFEENLLRFDDEGNAVGGRLALLASLEARLDVGHDLELTAFVDTGSVRDTEVAAGDDDFRWSTGLGLQYITPIGPIGVFYGYKLDRREGESSGEFHLSIGYAF